MWQASFEVAKSWDEADGETAEAIDIMEWYARQMLDLAKPRTPAVLPIYLAHVNLAGAYWYLSQSRPS